MLPNLSVTAVIFMALQIYRKAPVFLNYSSGPRGLGLAMDIADIGTVITSRQFLERLKLTDAVFGTRKPVFLEDLKDEVGLGDKLFALFRAFFPGGFAAVRAGEEKETAAILFTSGSEGLPKGVCLSHENIITNVYQGLSRIGVTPEDTFLNVLPMFHSFGLTGGTIIPVFAGARVFFPRQPPPCTGSCRSSPITTNVRFCSPRIPSLTGTARRAQPLRLPLHAPHLLRRRSRLAIQSSSGTQGRSACRSCPGYGATECGPSLASRAPSNTNTGRWARYCRASSIGSCRLRASTSKGGTTGRLLVRGKNVMKGYLKNEAGERASTSSEDRGWYDTGDIVEITEEGLAEDCWAG